MKHITIFTLCLLYFQSAFTQVSPNKFVTSLKEKKYELVTLQIRGAHSISVEGYDGTDLIVELVDTAGKPVSLPEETAGLKDITSLVNKPVRGSSIQPLKIYETSEKDTITEKFTISLLWMLYLDQNLLIRVPRSTNLSLSLNAISTGSKISAKNLTGELNISGNVSFITVSHISGPLLLRSSGINELGKVTISDVDWKAIQAKTPNTSRALYVSCTQHDVDISIPADLKANISAGSDHDAFYSDLIPATQAPKSTTSAHNSLWPINGGGIGINIHTTYGNIYLHKEK